MRTNTKRKPDHDSRTSALLDLLYEMSGPRSAWPQSASWEPCDPYSDLNTWICLIKGAIEWDTNQATYMRFYFLKDERRGYRHHHEDIRPLWGGSPQVQSDGAAAETKEDKGDNKKWWQFRQKRILRLYHKIRLLCTLDQFIDYQFNELHSISPFVIPIVTACCNLRSRPRYHLWILQVESAPPLILSVRESALLPCLLCDLLTERLWLLVLLEALDEPLLWDLPRRVPVLPSPVCVFGLAREKLTTPKTNEKAR